jgi:hypothetical protein
LVEKISRRPICLTPPVEGKRLPLNHVNRPGYENAQGVHFAMRHNDTTVRVLVTRAAILGGGKPPMDGAYLASFEARREFFESLASEKFDSDGPRAKITITREDLLLDGMGLPRLDATLLHE